MRYLVLIQASSFVKGVKEEKGVTTMALVMFNAGLLITDRE